MKTKRILITGNNGYIASNLKLFLEKFDYEVGGFDRKQHIYAETFKLPKKHDLHAIIHLAAESGIEETDKDPERAFKSNVLGAHNIFNEAYNHDIQVVFASSQAAKDPKNLYGWTKRFGEYYADSYNNLGARIRVLRFANVYGGINFVENKTSVIAKFLRAYKANNSLIVNSTGSQTRDFIHVNDVCNAILLSLYCNRDYDLKLDIGTGIQTSVLDLAKMITNNIEFNTNTSPGIFSNVANTKLAGDVLGFYAREKLEDYINDQASTF